MGSRYKRSRFARFLVVLHVKYKIIGNVTCLITEYILKRSSGARFSLVVLHVKYKMICNVTCLIIIY